ncbi:SagB/ThcOx family dehydrogenase [Pelagibius litoralis]|uniref:SagB/ThcOx family dehydrogenase n=1 Tax=Pelagibius litoralis TaxID=374515 RepID=A0A967KII2_9PROT|nr:SagB/ThcOx family dehydrogenase [Pelagibius litoralis]NIA72316.1 SagB/ThcOx family dehydrogenase [Pelagibius litoralis]
MIVANRAVTGHDSSAVYHPEAPANADPWSRLATFTFDPLEGGVVISDPVSGRKLRIAPTVLSKLISDPEASTSGVVREKLSEVLQNKTDRPQDMQGWEKWRDREWIPSLDLHLWSRWIKPIDKTNHRAGHERAIKEYLRSASPMEATHPPGKVVSLDPASRVSSERSFGELAMRRRTMRRYSTRPTPGGLFSAWLQRGFGHVRRVRGLDLNSSYSHYLKTHGLAFDFYMILYNVEGKQSGVYFYRPVEQDLVEVRPGDFRQEMTRMLIGQTAPLSASWTAVFVADFPRYQWRYRHDRGLRHLYIDAGWVGQELIWAGMQFGLGALPTPATRDSDLCDLLKVDPCRYAPIYTLTFGQSPEATSSPKKR